MVSFQIQNSNLGKFWPQMGKCWKYFRAIWNILRIFYDHLVHFVFIWYIFPVLVSCTSKNLATLIWWLVRHNEISRRKRSICAFDYDRKMGRKKTHIKNFFWTFSLNGGLRKRLQSAVGGSTPALSTCVHDPIKLIFPPFFDAHMESFFGVLRDGLIGRRFGKTEIWNTSLVNCFFMRCR
jgi:hypothetical protein